MIEWKDIASAPTKPVDKDGPIAWGPYVLLRSRTDNGVGRWRHPHVGYNIVTDEHPRVAGRWEDQDRNPLRFEPQEWAPHAE